MKIVAKKIDTIVSFMDDDRPMPLRFRIRENDVSNTVKIDKVISVEKTNKAGVTAYIYRCQSEMDGNLRQYELRYKIVECKWDLYKI